MIRLFRQRKKPVAFSAPGRDESETDAPPRLDAAVRADRGDPAQGGARGEAGPSPDGRPDAGSSIRLAIRPSTDEGHAVPPRPAASPLDEAASGPGARRRQPCDPAPPRRDGPAAPEPLAPLSGPVRRDPASPAPSVPPLRSGERSGSLTATPTAQAGRREPAATLAGPVDDKAGRTRPTGGPGAPAPAASGHARFAVRDSERETAEPTPLGGRFSARPAAPDPADAPAGKAATASGATAPEAKARPGALVSMRFGIRREPATRPTARSAGSVPATLADTQRTDALPRFRRRAVAPENESQVTPIERARADLLDAFSPGRPKAGVRDFSGRGTQIGEIIAAIEELGASVVLYGERGLGKTTMANTLAEIATEAGYVIARRACDSETTYDSLMRSLLRGLSIRFASREIGDRMPPGSTFEALLPERPLRAADVTDALKRLSVVRVIFVIDEFDRSIDERLRVQLAETIKILADERVPVHFIVIGVSETLHQLIGVHPSLERNLTGVRMPLMSFEEIDAMIDRGEAMTNMCFDRAARQRIAYLSCGTPYAAQLLCLYAGTHALSRESFDVGVQDVGFALHRTLNALDRSVVEAYDAATRGGRAEWLVDILFAAATAPADNFGRFDLNDASEAARQHEALPALPAIRLSRGLYELAKPGTCQVLARETTATGEIRYRFTNQLMRLYTLARQAQVRGLI